jgi:GrpB protein
MGGLTEHRRSPDHHARIISDQEAGRIHSALGSRALRIDHIGSTSVPGLSAKPVIDIAISVRELDHEAVYRRSLEQIGYEYGDQLEEVFDQRRSFKLNRAGTRIANLHVTLAGSREERRHLAFRDALRSDRETLRRINSSNLISQPASRTTVPPTRSRNRSSSRLCSRDFSGEGRRSVAVTSDSPLKRRIDWGRVGPWGCRFVDELAHSTDCFGSLPRRLRTPGTATEPRQDPMRTMLARSRVALTPRCAAAMPTRTNPNGMKTSDPRAS